MTPSGPRGEAHHVRLRRATLADAAALASLSRAAIIESAATHYTQEQLAAWARRRTVDAHERMIRETRVVVAETGASPAGFASVALDATASLVAGEVDQLFVHPTCAGGGVAATLLEAVEDEARRSGLDRLVTHASLRAAAVFTRAGYRPEEEEIVHLDGQALRRFLMSKELRTSLDR